MCFHGFSIINLSVFLCHVLWSLLYCLFILAVAVQAGYGLYFFSRVFQLPGENIPAANHLPISVVICAKNEGENLRKNLPTILSQQYFNEHGKPNYEVIVVNDASTDDTAEVLKELEMQYDNLWDVVIPPDAVRDLKGKKFALGKGVAHAANDWLVLTDADCIPASDKWLAQMVAPLAQGKEIVAGYGGYNKMPGLLNAFIRWETLHTFLQYSTYTLAGQPYMAVGRNMACTKAVMKKASEAEVWNALPSGDDDLLVSIAGTAENMAVVADASAFTWSDVKRTFSEWVKQKQRHLSAGKYYKQSTKWLLAFYAAAHALMWLSFLPLLLSGHWQMALIVMMARCLVYWGLWAVTAVKLKEASLIYLFPLFDIGWLVYNFAFFPYITWKNKQQWR